MSATRRSLRRRLVVVGMILAVLAGLAFNVRLLLDPQEVRRRAEGALATLFIGPVEIDSAEARFPNVLVLRGVRIARPEKPDEPVIELSHVRVVFSVLGSLTGRPAPRRIVLDGAVLRVERREDGSFDVQDVLRPPEPGSGPAPRPAVRLRNARIVYRDVVLRPGASIEARSVALLMEPDGSFAAQGEIPGLGRLRAVGSPGGRDLHARVEGLRLEAPLEDIAPEPLVEALTALRPEGPVALDVRLRGDPGGLLRPVVRLELLGVRVAPALPHAPDGPTYAVEDLRGDVVLRENTIEVKDVTGRHAATDLLVRGDVRLLEAGVVADIVVEARNALADEEAQRLLPPGARPVAQAFDPRMHGDLTVRLRSESPGEKLDPEFSFRVGGGQMRFRGYRRGPEGERLGFPYRLDVTGGLLHYHRDTLTIADARGVHGAARLQAGGSVYFHTLSSCDVDVSVLARGIRFDEDLEEAFGDRAEYLLGPFEPEGLAERVHVHIRQVAKRDRRAWVRVTIDFDGGAALRPAVFPLRVEGVRGRIQFGPKPELGPEVEVAEFEAMRGRGPDGSRVRMDGEIRNWGAEDESFDVVVRARDVPVDDRLQPVVAASILPATIAEGLRSAAPYGLLDADVTVGGVGDDIDVEFRLEPRGVTTGGLPAFPYPIRALQGVLTFAENEAVIPWVSARAGAGRLDASGRLAAGGNGRMSVRFEGVAPDETLASALRAIEPESDEIWRRLVPDPGGRFDGGVDLVVAPEKPLTGRVTIVKPSLRLRPRPEVGIEIDGGLAEILLPDGAVRLAGVSGKLNGASFFLDGALGDGPPAITVTSDPLGLREDLGWILPPSVVDVLDGILEGGRVAMDPLRLGWEGPEIRLTGSRLVIYRPEKDEDGLSIRGALRLHDLLVMTGHPTTFTARAELEGVSLTAGVPIEDLRGRLDLSGAAGSDVRIAGEARELTGKVWGRDLTGGGTPVTVEDGLLRLAPLTGDLAGGRVDARIRVRIEDPYGVNVRLLMNDVDLGRFLAAGSAGATDPEVSGDLDADIKIAQDGPEIERLSGKGSIRVRDAALWDIPVFTAIFRALSALPPIEYRPVFRAADIAFRLRGDRLLFDDIEFRSDILSLERGRGTVSLFGDVDLVLVPKVRTIDIPGVSDLWNLIKAGLVYRVRVKGTLERPSAQLEPLPFLHGEPGEEPRVVPEFLGKIRPKRGLGL